MTQTRKPRMTAKHQETILRAAIEAWGIQSQMMMAFGECGEFVALAGHQVQGRLTREALVDEIADVTIMMRQMAIIHGQEAVEDLIRFKLARLGHKIAKYQAAHAIAQAQVAP